jgi:hypothetical protein
MQYVYRLKLGPAVEQGSFGQKLTGLALVGRAGLVLYPSRSPNGSLPSTGRGTTAEGDRASVTTGACSWALARIQDFNAALSTRA